MFIQPGILMAAGGATLLALLVFQVLAGKRIIKLGRNHLKIHTWIGYLMVAGAVGHGALGLYFFVLPR